VRWNSTERELPGLSDLEGREAELRKGFREPGRLCTAELPANFEMPQGVEFKIDASDPLDFRAGLGAFEGVRSARRSARWSDSTPAPRRRSKRINAAHADQVARMGPNGPMRVTALETWLRGVVGDRLAGPMRTMMATADIVKGLEIIQHKLSSQGAASFSQQHREPQDRQGRVSEAEFANMTPAAKLDYTRGFDQRQFTDAHGQPR
jgi:hypothetical protein